MIGFHDASDGEVERNVLGIYRALHRRYLEERKLIPAGNLVEVGFAELERDALTTLRRIYEALDLPGYDLAEPAFRAYAASQAGYRRNEYELSAADEEKVSRCWGFAFQAFGYPLRGAEARRAAA